MPQSHNRPGIRTGRRRQEALSALAYVLLLLPGWVRILGTTVLLAAFVPLGFWPQFWPTGTPLAVFV